MSLKLHGVVSFWCTQTYHCIHFIGLLIWTWWLW